MAPGIAEALFATAIGLAAAYGFVHSRAHNPLFAITPGQMPACDSPAARHLLRTAIDDSLAAHTEGLHTLRVDTVIEDVPDAGPDPDRRTCVATVLTNAGRKLLVFTLTWSDAAKNDVYLEIPGGLD